MSVLPISNSYEKLKTDNLRGSLKVVVQYAKRELEQELQLYSFGWYKSTFKLDKLGG
jgi:hypothetical protein